MPARCSPACRRRSLALVLALITTACAWPLLRARSFSVLRLALLTVWMLSAIASLTSRKRGDGLVDGAEIHDLQREQIDADIVDSQVALRFVEKVALDECRGCW